MSGAAMRYKNIQDDTVPTNMNGRLLPKGVWIASLMLPTAKATHMSRLFATALKTDR